MHRIYAFYFPQLYSIPENDLWWGEGFTDWKLVQQAKPNFPGHMQPRVPALGYLNQSLPEVIAKQGRLAAQYGVSGFNFYHYWFDDRPLLEKPLENLHADSSIPVEFMLTWANESWTRQWIGKPNDYLIKQTYQMDSNGWMRHYRYLARFFADPRYVKVGNAPVFCIYRPELIPDLPQRLEAYRQFARADGFSDLHILACRAYDIAGTGQWTQLFNGVINFNPRYILNRYLRKVSYLQAKGEKLLRVLPERIQSAMVGFLRNKQNYSVYDYQEFLMRLANPADAICGGLPAYSSVFPDWDNTARYSERATLFRNASPAAFRDALRIVKGQLSPRHQPWVFINAWNEWSEGAYLEPDKITGLRYLHELLS
ncbi:glycoside hydrolase family 99-like domain-containing protein [Silvimonas sp.]|uniref:glycosyltransferase WbsX family protein n=1 Tax=Silvimonas sp. TaxID=2650811 RepID=UPI002840EB06|nr:glycoside hydrolase family 99-like domain-containing protein [Silvimonas sp.]MDR3429434.1 glycoside hydrolase family 99-like domain-containing protein [Silvimonas sp.]